MGSSLRGVLTHCMTGSVLCLGSVLTNLILIPIVGDKY